MLDLQPATTRMASLLGGVTDEQLAARTPCPRYTLGDLIHHVDGLSLAFTTAATKRFGPGGSQAPPVDAARLSAEWRVRIPDQLSGLAAAWRDPEAWEGMTQAGGVDLPAPVAAAVALNELTVHGWDISRASGQPYDCDPASLDVCTQFLAQAGPRGDAFGPVVEVPADASALDRMIGLSGRDPLWR